MTITVTLGKRPELTPDEAHQRIRRAAEVLNGAGWLFDEYISDLTQQMLDTPDVEGRNGCYLLIRAAAELKARLAHIVNSKPLVDKQNERGNR